MASRRVEFETWNVFTDRRFSGNPLGVVFGADALSAEQMQAVTREFDYPETIFVLEPAAAAHDARVRIFTPGGELPFAGHPVVGVSCALSQRADRDDDLLLELPAGRFPVRVRREGEGGFAEFENPNLPAVHRGSPDPARIERALSLPAGCVSRGAHRPRRAGAGIDFIYARAGLEAVRDARLDTAAWRELAIGEACGVLLYASGGEQPDIDWHVRMFAPHIGVPEDAATGSAAAALPAQVHAAGSLADGRHEWWVEQGVEMGRPSRIRVRVDVRREAIERVRVGGHAVPVMSGRMRV